LLKNVGRLAFVIALIGSGYSASPSLALALGLALAFILGNPFPAFTSRWSKWLLQISVVGLGFGMSLADIMRAGRSGFLYTLLGISFAIACGLLLGRGLAVQRIPSALISIGTAICGGSAIAAVAPVLDADEHDVAVSLGTVFILNAIALFLFPPIGHYFRLSETQFGIWSALAIHDTSSVVGAAARYGNLALAVAATVKLTRALWIVPVTLVVAALKNHKTYVQVPWFILMFVVASVARSYSPPSFIPGYAMLLSAAKVGLAVTLFLIGSGLSRKAIAEVGIRPLIQGVLLWAIVAIGSIWLVRSGLI